jgi:hypothetical protein
MRIREEYIFGAQDARKNLIYQKKRALEANKFRKELLTSIFL